MDKIKIGSKLKSLIEKKKTNIKLISERTGIPASTIYGWTNDNPPTDLAKVIKLATYFDITLDELLSSKPRRSTPFEQLPTSNSESCIYRITIERVSQ